MSAPAPTSDIHTKIFLFSHPRTRSNLFMKLLQTHPRVVGKQYPFMVAFQHGPEAQWSKEKIAAKSKASGLTSEEFEKKYANVTYQTGLDDMEKLFAKANAEGNFCVIKEHTVHMLESQLINANIPFPRHETRRPVIIDHKFDVVDSSSEEVDTKFPVPNPSLLPDRVAASISPVIIIRHPMFVLPSFARAAAVFGGTVFESDFVVMTSYRWQRMIHDFYRAYYNKIDLEGKKNWPIVIDGDKLVNDTQGQMKRFCEIIGLDESLMRYSWDASNTQMDTVYHAFIGTISKSTGIIRGSDASNTTLDQEVKKWTEEWDENVSQKIKEVVESSMEDYEYLLKFSI